ncbi:TPA: hypothetical protein QCU53_002196 [Bacillus thuringiensis]|nr:hypothetical protein [Bacillus thuringiensis]
MKREIGTAVVGLSVLGFGIFGFSHGNGGGVVQAASVGDGGGAPSYTHGHTGAPVYGYGDYPAPSFNGGDTPAPKLEADGDHGGAPTYTHGHFPAPKLESHGNTGVPANTEPGGRI